MFLVSVEESFAAGHALRGYRGKCENVHGHNYKIRVTLEGSDLNAIGLLYDFKDLKEAIQCSIRKLDHRFMNDVPPFDAINPSAENLAKYFYEEVTRLLADGTTRPQAPCRVRAVTVWETDTTTATYFKDSDV
ncbi:MAG: 6-carboxytetrahydropterin synthase QueD [bacterium]|nr:6-carboxytetrahydropterin synthase QueD [bacterium]